MKKRKSKAKQRRNEFGKPAHVSNEKPLSRQRKRIHKAAAELGIEIERLTWEPIGKAGEKVGPSGGWRLEDAEERSFYGYNVDELISEMNTWHNVPWYR